MSPTVIESDVLLRLTPVTATVLAFTVTAHVAVFAPSAAFTVIVADPAALAVTTPEEDTVATVVLLDDHVTDLFVAFEGVTVATKEYVSPSVRDKLVLSKLTPVTGMTLALTVTVLVAVLFPSLVVTVIFAVPSATASTRPDEETVAIDGALDFHETSFMDAFAGLIEYVNEAFSPSVNVNAVGESETDSTAIYFPFFPSCVTVKSAASEPALMIIFPSRLYSSFSAAEKFAIHS